MNLLQATLRHIVAFALGMTLIASGTVYAQVQKSAPTKPATGEPVLVGIDAEFSDATSTSDDAIRLGIRLAIEEINAAGGVLGGRPLKLVERDNRSVPARGVANAIRSRCRRCSRTPVHATCFASECSRPIAAGAARAWRRPRPMPRQPATR